MKKKEIQEKFGIEPEIFGEYDYNPLRIVLDEEWKRNSPDPNDPDYRERAIDRCIAAKVEFHSEFNTLPNIMEKFFKVENPISGNEMKFGVWSGSRGSQTFTYKDKGTGDLVQITLSHDAIRVIPKGDK